MHPPRARFRLEGFGLQPEQVWNIDQCVAQGNAIALSPKQAGTRLLADAVERILADERVRASADRVAQAFRAEDGGAAAARYLEAQIASIER